MKNVFNKEGKRKRQKEREICGTDFKISIGYEEYNWLKTFLVENLEMLTEPPIPEDDDEIGIIKDILNVMEKRWRHPSMITLTYDQIMEVAELIYHRIDYCDDVYDEYDDNPRNIRLLYEFDIIKEIMKSLSETHIPSIEEMESEINEATDALTDPERQPLCQHR